MDRSLRLGFFSLVEQVITVHLAFAIVVSFTCASFAHGQVDRSIDNVASSQREKERAEAKSRFKNSPLLRNMGFTPHDYHVAISGRTTDEQGTRIANARVFVVPVGQNGMPSQIGIVLAEGTSNVDGDYRFKDVELTILESNREQAVPMPIEAQFQVFALAEGYGYVWKGTHSFRPGKRPEEDSQDLKSVFFADEPINVDLVFSPEVRLHGQVTDENGRPIQEAVVQVGLVNSPREMPKDPPRIWSVGYKKGSARAVDGRFNGMHYIPEKYRLTRTDAAGRYELPGIPRDANLLINIDYLPETQPWGNNIDTGSEPLENGEELPYSGELNATIAIPESVHVRVTDANEKPIKNVIVRIRPERTLQRGATLARTDGQGGAVVKIPRGNVKLFAEPNFGVPFLPVEHQMNVTEPIDQPIQFVLAPTADVTFEAVEKESGRPIAGISFLCEGAESRERKQVQTQISFVDHPITDRTGKLNAYLAPGDWVFFVDQKHSVHEFEPIAPSSEIVSLKPGVAQTVRFEFARRRQFERSKNHLAEVISDELKPFAQMLEDQQQRFRELGGMRMYLRHNNSVTGTLKYEKLIEMLEAFESKSVDECLLIIQAVLPECTGFSKNVLLTDGRRRRAEVTYPEQATPTVMVFNGEELAHPMGEGDQLDLFSYENSRIHFLDRNDFWHGPAQSNLVKVRKSPDGTTEPHRMIQRAGKNWIVETTYEQGITRSIIDSVTGFVIQDANMKLDRRVTQETRSYFPTLLANGVAAPQLSLTIFYYGESKVRLIVTAVDRIEMIDRLSPDAFIVSAPAGTNVIDYRHETREDQNNGRRAPSGVLYGEVPDIFAYRNQFAPPSPPVLKVGDAAPAFRIESWVNSDGKIDAPNLERKIIVIDFWGIGCGPCVAQLPEVNAAAKHFENLDIAIIGVHTAGVSPDKVVEFVRGHYLRFPHGLDSIDPTRRSFGATHAAFGIPAIPTSVVIDRSGIVTYIGQFNRAIENALQLAKKP